MFLADPDAGQATQDDDDDFAYDTEKNTKATCV